MHEEKEIKKLWDQMTPEYKEYVSTILEHPEFVKRKEYHHHENRSVYTHCMMVSIKSYQLAKKFHFDEKVAAIGGLLHDFYYKDWQLNKEKKPFFQSHGFVHPKEALENSRKFFPELMDPKIENSIVRHMFPLTFIPPKYKEGWIITLVDKYVSLEIFKTPKELYKYVGIRKKGRK